MVGLAEYWGNRGLDNNNNNNASILERDSLSLTLSFLSEIVVLGFLAFPWGGSVVSS